MSQSEHPEFDASNPRVVNGTVVEASAGTGKTFAVAALVAHTIAVNEDIRIGNILVTTFTRLAAAELRDRIRRRLVSLERQLRAGTAAKDDLLAAGLLGDQATVRADRLARALREFDTATIATIHSVCARILAMAGLPVAGGGDESDLARIVSEVVNDAVVSEAIRGNFYDPSRLRDVVEARLGSPLSVLSYAPHRKASLGRTAEELNAGLDHLIGVVEECVARIRERTETQPTFDDLLRRAAELLADKNQVVLTAALRQRFRLAVIDEAQDTDKLQWSVFQHIFDPGSVAHTLVAVGDPKQAIYRFRGADIEAYLSVRRDDKRQTLSRNWRSDAELLKALNHLFDGWTFGEGIDYVPVRARDGAPASSISGSKPLVIIDLGPVGNKNHIVGPTALRVREILETVSIITKDGGTVSAQPGDICVLVASKRTGAAVEAALRDLGVSAVSSGTENVMKGEMGVAFARLFRAMAETRNTSLIRLVAATPFFGAELADAGGLDEGFVEDIQRSVTELGRTLRSGGVAAVAAQIRGDEKVAARIVRGDAGERRETDFAHVVELLHSATAGIGCQPSDVLEAISSLSAREDQSETVSRRVESDRDAVKIMTVHVAKGLEFPIVVVADLWKTKRASSGADQFNRPKVGAPDESERVIDAGYVLKKGFPAARAARESEEADEVMRLFYVALTRAKHHVSLIVGGQPEGNNRGGRRVTEGLNDPERFAPVSRFVEVVKAGGIRKFPRYQAKKSTEEQPSLAPFGGSTAQTYLRMSFSGIAEKRKGRQTDDNDIDDRSGAGHNDDHDEQIISIRSGYCDDTVPLGVPEMPLARLIGGTYLGKIMHSVYERVNFAAPDLETEVSRVVDEVVNGALLRGHRDELIRGVALSLSTPLGGPFGPLRLAEVGPEDRLNELSFEIGLADAKDDVKVSDIGRTLLEVLEGAGRAEDVLAPYARELASKAFDIPLMGLMNGSIDTLLRVTVAGAQSLWISDWKSNRLDEDGMDNLIDGYRRDRMCEAMEHHHYPLQALIYGVAVHRYVRSRSAAGTAPAVAGLAYFFIRGMVGDGTPVDGNGHRNGVFVWEAPDGLWDRLSDVMSGVRA